MKTAKDIMKKPITIDRESSIFDVINKMLHMNISRLLVTDDGRPIGIVTEKDLGYFLLQDKTDRNLDEISATEVMKRLVSVNESIRLGDCAKIMLDKEISSLAVESSNRIVGVFTKTDLTKYYADNYGGKKTAGDFMTTKYVWLYSDETLNKVASQMMEKKISRMILKNRDGIPEGIISFRDLFRISLDKGSEEFLEDNTHPDVSLIFSRKGFLSESGFGGVTRANQIMKDRIVSVIYDDDLADASQKLLENKLKGIGVLSTNGELIGILSKTDVTQALATMVPE
jgi:CBS domain-containing protein